MLNGENETLLCCLLVSFFRCQYCFSWSVSSMICDGCSPTGTSSSIAPSLSSSSHLLSPPLVHSPLSSIFYSSSESLFQVLFSFSFGKSARATCLSFCAYAIFLPVSCFVLFSSPHPLSLSCPFLILPLVFLPFSSFLSSLFICLLSLIVSWKTKQRENCTRDRERNDAQHATSR